ncbi:MAG: hypothetical protein Q4D96_08585 [Propionibacteriaceae bacterium]|nr:hypothetical protein [Propionibacteriaceae bacterium]
MDTKDLQNLFNRPSGTRLSAASVLQHAEGRRRSRRRAAVVGVAVTLSVAVGLGVMQLGASTSSPGPDVLATPAPPPSTATATAALGSSRPERRCEVMLPDSWRRVIEAAPRSLAGQDVIPVRGGGVVRTDPETVIWERPGEEQVIIHDVNGSGEEVWAVDSDSRFVVFQVGERLMVWDVESPDEKPRRVSGRIEVQERWRAVSAGQLWLASEARNTVLHADLTRGEVVGRVALPEGYQVREPVAGRAQLIAEGQDTLLLDPDGTTTPLDGPPSTWEVLGSADEVLLIAPWQDGWKEGNKDALLWSPQWPEPFPVPGASGLVGDWVVFSDNRLFNHRTGVGVRFDNVFSLRLAGTGEEAHLKVEYDQGSGYLSDNQTRTLRLSELPEVSC